MKNLSEYPGDIDDGEISWDTNGHTWWLRTPDSTRYRMPPWLWKMMQAFRAMGEEHVRHEAREAFKFLTKPSPSRKNGDKQ